MKIYCSCCDKVQPVRIDNCRDAKTNEPFQDIVCAECDLVIAAGTDIVPPAQQQEPVAWMVTTEMQDGTRQTYLLTGRYKDVLDTCDFGSPIPLYTTPQLAAAPEKGNQS